MSDQASGTFGLNLGAGMILGIVVGLGAATAYAHHAGQRARQGWNLVPVLVASDELAAGAPITYDVLSQRAVPEQFVTASVVRPDSANQLVGKKIAFAVHAGDPMLWAMFPSPDAGPSSPH